MFTANTVQDVLPEDEALFTGALAAKLSDIDRTRINRSDELVLRKAVFGLLEIVSVLESRVTALEGPEAEAFWRARFESDRAEPSPDEMRIGE